MRILLPLVIVLSGCTKSEAVRINECVRPQPTTHVMLAATTTPNITRLATYRTLSECQAATTTLVNGLPPSLLSGAVSIVCIPTSEDK